MPHLLHSWHWLCAHGTAHTFPLPLENALSRSSPHWQHSHVLRLNLPTDLLSGLASFLPGFSQIPQLKSLHIGVPPRLTDWSWLALSLSAVFCWVSSRLFLPPRLRLRLCRLSRSHPPPSSPLLRLQLRRISDCLPPPFPWSLSASLPLSLLW